MIVVTGAAGNLGRGVVEHLLETSSIPQVVASTRDPAKLAVLAGRGVEVRAGDFADPAALQESFKGATQVLLVSVDKIGDDARRLHRNAIDAARMVGAVVLYTSHMGARADSPFAPAADHAAIEADLARTGEPFTALRHGFYAESALHMIGDWQSGEIRAPEDGPVSWTARADLAEADAVILAGSAQPGITPPLTATDAITLTDIASIASALTGRAIVRVTLTDEQWIAEKVAAGVPAPTAAMLLGSFLAARRGEFAATDRLLETLLGRPPRSMRDVLLGVLGG